MRVLRYGIDFQKGKQVDVNRILVRIGINTSRPVHFKKLY